ncbi:MAG TPA: alpha-2-macroglobulin family protein, partial [Saprospiraceae bacterium]|nr:alpha-2-macroglobulin family protein [Saprospiraceae bacterium]
KLYDANSKEVSSKSYTSNAYGTFSGQLDLPKGGLTGRMYITSSFGNSRYHFQVEEYKRPKFEVTFDTLKETARLDETVTVKAVSKDYAGSVVSGAQVAYRVERSSYLPWWYGYWRKFAPMSDDRQVLATGHGITDENGSINISFPAKSKPGKNDNLIYHFDVTVMVTDITGETHEATKTLTLNKQGFDVGIDLGQAFSINDLHKIVITATNSDGAEVNVTGTVEIAKLTGPNTNKRDRLWGDPDVLKFTDQDYSTRFADYFAPGKEDKSKWPVSAVIGSKTFNIGGKDTVELASLVKEPGYYRFTWKWKDQAGKELVINQNGMAYVTGKPLPAGELFYPDWKEIDYEPGQTAKAELLTGLNTPPSIIQTVERRLGVTTREWFSIPGQSNIEIKEDDRGGVVVNYLVAYNNRFHHADHVIRVPWSNKDLQVELKTWRDKMEPGDNETWTIVVKGDKGEKVTAEMLMSMYDASLDAFIPHQWSIGLYPYTYSRYMIQDAGPREVSYWGLTYHWDRNYQDVPYRQYRDLNTYGYYPEGSHYPGGYEPYMRGSRAVDGVVMMEAPQAMPAKKDIDLQANDEMAAAPPPAQEKETPVAPPLRSALDETVFFYPQMMTDADGNLTFNFKMKEGLTRWKFQALAHTKELAYGLITKEVVTQKQLMVFPNPPRFFRTGDTIDFQIKVTNLTADALTGNAKLNILDAFTNEDVSAQWKLTSSEKPVQITAGGSAAQSWTLQVPKDWTRPVKYQVSAKAGNFTDGEESLLPVVTNRVLITETLPLPVKANETRTFIFKSMQDQHSNTLTNHQYVVEMTSSPAWYAVQALPYLMEFPHECAEQIFSRLYANTLAAHIANKYPAIKQVYDAWRQTGDDALLSNLEKNQDLKSAMLEETPWVRDAMGESMQKKDIALLFEPNRLSSETSQALQQLRDMQLSNGGFPWFPGGRDNWYITQYIIEGFGHLKKMGVPLNGGESASIVQRAIPYIDSRMIEWYDDLKRLADAGKIKMDEHQISGMQVHYIYTRSFYPDIPHLAKLDEINNYVKSQMEKYWLEHGVYDQGLMALGTFRQWPNDPLPAEILKSLRERTIKNDELGRYWKIPAGYYWNESPIEMQSLMIELFQDMKVPQAEVDELRVWLLKQKQTTRWKSTKATSAAIYALLIHPDTWLTTSGIVEVKLGGKSVINAASNAEAGTGYVKETWDGKEIQPGWSTIEVINPNNHIAWGSAYWQFWEDIDKVKSTVDNNPLKVSRALLITQNSDRGEQTVIAEGRHLKVGDKLIVRLVVETDRPMDYVHLKDLRASGFEPMDVISGYHWSGGVGYYQSTKDLATHFFIDRLPRGKFVIEYPVTVAQAGSYSEGLATLQCMYAPEFSDHSAGSRVSAAVN